MASNREIDSWAAREGLPTEIVSVLKQQHFTCVDHLRILTPETIKQCLQDTGFLKLAHCLALKKAVAKLSRTTITTSPTPTTSPPPPPPQNLYPGLPPRPSHFPPPSSLPYPQSSHPHHPPTGAYPGEVLHYPYPASHAVPTGPIRPAAPCGLSDGCGPGRPEFVPHVHGAAVPFWAGRINEATPTAKECFRFLLLGKTGSGKSTTGNTIFGERLFDTAATFASVTAECERKTSYRDGRKFEIIDSPGLYDTHKTQEEICVVIVQAVAGMHPGPHAILYVVRLGRYTAEEHGAYQRLKALFDDTIRRYLIVVFTYGDMLERDQKTIADLIGPDTPETLRQVLSECNNRYIVFNNVASDPRPQVEQLLQMVRQMVAENGGKPYSCPKYGNIGAGMEQEVARRLQEVEKRDLQRQKYVQQLEQQTKEAEESAHRTQKQFQKNEEERQRRMQEEEERRRQLEEQLQDQIKQQQIGFEHYQQELQLLHQQQEAQERMMKEKEAEMTERERKRAEEEAERMRQREQEMQAMMKEQEERVRRQRQEDEDRRQQVERERREFMQQMEEQRRKDREELERREEERERLWKQQREEERETARIREENYEKEMERLKSQVVAKEDTGFIDKFVNTIAGIAKTALNWLFKKDC